MTLHRSKLHSAAFTLIEIIVSVSIFSVIMFGILALLSNTFTLNRQQSGLLDDQDQARKLSFALMNELRNATTANTGAYPLETVSAQTLTFYSNIDGGTDIERVRYYLQNGALYKGVKKPTGNPLSYTAATETVTRVQSNISGSPTIFTYYDDSYNGVTGAALTQPVSVVAVRFVKVDLPILKRAGVTNTNTYTVTAQAAVRSLKTNLGDAPAPTPTPPTVTLQANGSNGPVAVAYNTAASLVWSSTDTTNCTASGSWSGSVGVSGTQSTGALTTSQTYTLGCTGPGGTATDSVQVTVNPPPAPTVDLLANGSAGPITVSYNSTATLTWSSTTTTSCTATGGWSGSKTASGSWTSASLTATQTYTLQCTGPGGDATDSVVVNVSAPPPAQPSCVSAAPESTNANGNGTFYVYAYGVQDTTSLNFFVYKGSSQLLISGVDQGGGTWRGSVNLSLIPSKGWYTVEVLVSNNSFSGVLCASTQFRRR